MQVDWDTVPDSPTFCLEAGTYACECEGATEVDEGKPYFELHFRVIDGEHTGFQFSERVYMTPKARSRAKLLFSNLGLDLSRGETTEQDFRGRKAMVELEIEENEKDGRTYRNNRIAYAGIKPYGDGGGAAQGNGGEAPSSGGGQGNGSAAGGAESSESTIPF